MFSTKSEALKAEKKIKTLNKEEKSRLVHYPERLIDKRRVEPQK
jgi:predicted GIY-YIG superfamily endonuclease